MRSTLAGLVAVAGIALAGCGSPEPAGGALPPPSAVSTPTIPATTAAGPESAEALIVGVYDGIEFYPACGNEQLRHDGVVWHQVQEYEFPDVYDRVARGLREDPPDSVVVRGFAPRVAAPGPGDDVGTLVVWSDDVAYFMSDSGDLDAWLVREELVYGWVC